MVDPYSANDFSQRAELLTKTEVLGCSLFDVWFTSIFKRGFATHLQDSRINEKE
jgi:hypothetical protein